MRVRRKKTAVSIASKIRKNIGSKKTLMLHYCFHRLSAEFRRPLTKPCRPFGKRCRLFAEFRQLFTSNQRNYCFAYIWEKLYVCFLILKTDTKKKLCRLLLSSFVCCY